MNSNFEQKNTKPTMAEMQAMQKTALRRSMDKAGNIQKSITLTEAPAAFFMVYSVTCLPSGSAPKTLWLIMGALSF